MKLGDRKILKEIKRGNIVIKPYDRSRLGSNSYDVTLGPKLGTYQDRILDCKFAPEFRLFDIPPTGFVLQPGELYLGSTVEYTESGKYLPNIDGKSSVGRLGIFVHITAGIGDTGFSGTWTLEIVAVKPVRIYAGMPIAQLTWEKTTKVDHPYSSKASAKYTVQASTSRPVPSQMWRNFLNK